MPLEVISQDPYPDCQFCSSTLQSFRSDFCVRNTRALSQLRVDGLRYFLITYVCLLDLTVKRNVRNYVDAS